MVETVAGLVEECADDGIDSGDNTDRKGHE